MFIKKINMLKNLIEALRADLYVSKTFHARFRRVEHASKAFGARFRHASARHMRVLLLQ